jgi:protoporphyrinogen oxidase
LTISQFGSRFVVIGAGPAGLTAGLAAARRGKAPLVLERSSQVGGLARTCEYDGYRFDLGGHRFYTKVPGVDRLWREMLGDEFLLRPRLSRILYGGRYFKYPPEIGEVLWGFGAGESFKIVASWARAQLWPERPEHSFSQWVSNRFGTRLFGLFFKSYTEKVWGISCQELRSDWAAQRIKDVSLPNLLATVVGRRRHVKSLIREFHYPRLGPGMMWEAFRQRIEMLGGEVWTGAEVVRITGEGSRVRAAEVATAGRRRTISLDALVSTMPLAELVRCIDPKPPADVLKAGERLKYRAFITVCLAVRREHIFPDNWIYVHEPRVRVARIQNFKNWSPAMVPDQAMTSLGLEYFCNEADEFWSRSDEELVTLAIQELATIGLAEPGEIAGGWVERVPHAYPVYDANYVETLATVRSFVDRFENLCTVGRAGLHRYNNQDHSMVTAELGVRRLLDGEDHDLWSVNLDAGYLEQEIAGRHASPAECCLYSRA